MLKLSQGWRQHVGGAIALDLLQQIPDEMGRAQFSRTFILASLDLSIATFFGRGGRIITIHESARGVWKLLGLTYLFLPSLNDEAFSICRESLGGLRSAFVIVPNRHDVLLRAALKGSADRNSPTVMSFDGFISWRALTATLDANWPFERAVRYLLHNYNLRARSAGFGRSLVIRMPQPL